MLRCGTSEIQAFSEADGRYVSTSGQEVFGNSRRATDYVIISNVDGEPDCKRASELSYGPSNRACGRDRLSTESDFAIVAAAEGGGRVGGGATFAAAAPITTVLLRDSAAPSRDNLDDNFCIRTPTADDRLRDSEKPVLRKFRGPHGRNSIELDFSV